MRKFPIGDIVMTAFVWYAIILIMVSLGTAAIVCAATQKIWKLARGQH